MDAYVVQEVLREGLQLRRCLHEPLQHYIGIDFEYSRRAPDAQALSQARNHTHDQFDRGALAMQEGPEDLQKVAATGDTQQLSPGTRIVKIFELAFPLKVMLLSSPAHRLVFRPTITHTQRP